MVKRSRKNIVRDLSWLAFNGRVLQEAADKTVPLPERLRFLGIFSNNLDEFFRVRVATLNKMLRLGKLSKVHLEQDAKEILTNIHDTVIGQQATFDKIYAGIIKEMAANNIFIKNERQLNATQKRFVVDYFNDKVRTEMVPLMIQSIPQMPLLRDKSVYLACVLGSVDNPMLQRYALIEIPTKTLPRFVMLPSGEGQKHVILLEDIIRYNLSNLFAPFGFNRFLGYIIKVTRDAEMDVESDIAANLLFELQKGLKNRKKGKATRFIYDRNIDANLLDYLIKRLSLSKQDNLIAGGRIHNFKDFMDFPSAVFPQMPPRTRPILHPLLQQPCRIMEQIKKRDIMLHTPYHSFDPIIDLLREAAIDPFVQSIKITCYRLAKNSKVVNALINAVRNGKDVTVMMELFARFDEEANLTWKTKLEEEGVKVLVGLPNMKVHAKICLIKKKEFNKIELYGFVGTGNLNENTARYYGDHYLLTSNKALLNEVSAVFSFLENPNRKLESLLKAKQLAISPVSMRSTFLELIDKEMRFAKRKKYAELTVKMNSLVDSVLIDKLYEAARAGVQVNLIIRGICCMLTKQGAFKKPVKAISIVDEYLEHARVFKFHNNGNPLMYISSADWMIRNLDHRIEVCTPVYNKDIREELEEILRLQLAENVKGRILDNEQNNFYVPRAENEPEVRSQLAIYNYLKNKKY